MALGIIIILANNNLESCTDKIVGMSQLVGRDSDQLYYLTLAMNFASWECVREPLTRMSQFETVASYKKAISSSSVTYKKITSSVYYDLNRNGSS
jgi:hypothetical protein